MHKKMSAKNEASPASARIYDFGGQGGIERVEYEETDHYQLTRDFLNHRERYLQHLFES